jgi:intracellular sulfur oxidation DsrE/DsrF family protein
MLNRRNVFARLFAAAAGGAIVSRTTLASAAVPGAPKVAYHLSDADKVRFALGNIENHIKGEGGADKVQIVLVVNGPALKAFKSAGAAQGIAKRLAALVAANVTLGACGNTLDAQKITVADLLPGFVRIDEGGVVRLARLQAQGYAYIRP